MSIIQKIRLKLEMMEKGMQDRMQRGRKVSGQMRAERLRNKQSRVVDGKPGAVNTIRRHLLMRSTNPIDPMKEYWDRRKYERNKK